MTRKNENDNYLFVTGSLDWIKPNSFGKNKNKKRKTEENNLNKIQETIYKEWCKTKLNSSSIE